MRKLWLQGIKGVQSVDVLMPQGFSECTDIWMLIASGLSLKDLLVMRTTSTLKKIIAEKTLINDLNAGKMTPSDMRISTIKSLVDFFGETCSQITKLDLQNFHRVTDSDIEIISEHFTKLNCLLLNNGKITNNVAIHLTKMTLLTSLDLSMCSDINDFSFLQHCKGLISVDLRGCRQIDDMSAQLLHNIEFII